MCGRFILTMFFMFMLFLIFCRILLASRCADNTPNALQRFPPSTVNSSHNRCSPSSPPSVANSQLGHHNWLRFRPSICLETPTTTNRSLSASSHHRNITVCKIQMLGTSFSLLLYIDFHLYSEICFCFVFIWEVGWSVFFLLGLWYREKCRRSFGWDLLCKAVKR